MNAILFPAAARYLVDERTTTFIAMLILILIPF